MLLKDILLSKKDLTKVALKYKNEQLSYQQFYSGVLAHFPKIDQLNINKNVGIFLPNSIDYAVAYFLITFSDRVIIPINIDQKKCEIESTLDFCEINLIITNSEYKKILKEQLTDIDCLTFIYSLDDRNIDSIGNIDIFSQKSNVPNDVAIMLRTSGTTSQSKWVMLTHQNLINNVQSHIQSLQLNDQEKCLIALPMFFSYCNTAQFLAHLFLGATIVITDNFFIPRHFFKLVYEEGITNFNGVSSMLLMVLKFKNSVKHDLSSLKCIGIGGSSIPSEKLKELMEMFPYAKFVKTYGQTEASPRITTLSSEDLVRKIGSVGKPIAGITLRVLNEKKVDAKPSEVGEIIIKGKNVMKGYYKRPEETKKVIREGWLYTNDLGYLDQEGFLYLVGRKNNILISGGINIYPEEIEEVILNHYAVKECCVYSIKHDLLQEVPAARVVLENDKIGKVHPDNIIAYCRENLSDYKVPRVVEYVRELPKTPTGKIRRIDKRGQENYGE